jgi:RNA polymerase sigma factor (sigma-70 family)
MYTSESDVGEDVLVDRDQVGRLAEEAARGDETAWKTLVEGFSGLVWSITRSYGLSSADAADACQTVWLRLAEHIGRIDNPQYVGAWLATTARHEAVRVARLGARVVPTDDPAVLEVGIADEPSPEEAVVKSEHALIDSRGASRLWRALGALSARCQKLLRILSASPPPSYADVAAALGMPVGSIGPTRARCLRQLRRQLAGEVSETV